jgi:ribonuclease-3
MNRGEQEPQLGAVEAAFGATFRNQGLLRQAFVHRSYLNEHPSFPLPSNERLEFLGDAVIGFVAADWLYRGFETLSEGELTRLRAALVRAETLARAATALNLGQYIYLGRGEEASGGRRRQTLLAATFEALVGAAFLDLGLDVAGSFVRRMLEPELARVLAKETVKDYKSRLQELAQARSQVTPVYRTIAAEGPDHEKVFTVAVLLGERVAGTGKGHSKQEAEQVAARRALEGWGGDKGEGG